MYQTFTNKRVPQPSHFFSERLHDWSDIVSIYCGTGDVLEMEVQPIHANGDRTLEEHLLFPHDVGTGGGLRRRIREMVLGQDVF